MDFRKIKTALTIAGSDSSGGAGIQADLKTMLANGVYGMSAITALTAQNTTGVTAIMQVSPEFLCQQIDAVFTDIYPDAVKTGMVADGELIKVIAERLRFYKAGNIVAGRTFMYFIPLFTVAGVYLITVMILTSLVSKLERRLRKSDR